MSQQHENPQETDDLPAEGQQALSALRNIWSAQGQTSANLDEACGNTTSCKNMESVGFHGLADEWADAPEKENRSVGNNLRAAWRTKLEREGKLSQGGSVRDLVFGSSSEPKK
jgi:hypothetical protein